MIHLPHLINSGLMTPFCLITSLSIIRKLKHKNDILNSVFLIVILQYSNLEHNQLCEEIGMLRAISNELESVVEQEMNFAC